MALVKAVLTDRSEFWSVVESAVLFGLAIVCHKWAPDIYNMSVPGVALVPGLEGLSLGPMMVGLAVLNIGYAWNRMKSKDKGLNPKNVVRKVPGLEFGPKKED